MANLEEKINYIKLIRDRYRKSNKSKKGLILDDVCKLLCCDRKHAIKLAKHSRKVTRSRQNRKRQTNNK